MITYENVAFWSAIHEFFISWQRHIPFLRYSVFPIFNHSTIFQSCDVTIDLEMRNDFRKHFAWFGGLDPKSNQYFPNINR